MSETPEDVVMRKTFEKLWTYCTSLFAFEAAEALEYCGSGTLVRVDGRRCLLTAAHVWEELASHSQVALTIEGGRQAVTIRRNFLEPLFVSRRRSDEWGPDLALIPLPDIDASKFEARGKAFYDLGLHQSEALARPVDPRSGLRVFVGAPGEFVSSGPHPSDSDAGRSDVGVTLIASRALGTYAREEYDYVDVSLHDKRVEGFPSKYGGLSGSGLWRVGEDRDGKLVWDGRAHLEGVAFYHEPGASPEEERIRCHGPRSLYERLLNAVRGKDT